MSHTDSPAARVLYLPDDRSAWKVAEALDWLAQALHQAPEDDDATDGKHSQAALATRTAEAVTRESHEKALRRAISAREVEILDPPSPTEDKCTEGAALGSQLITRGELEKFARKYLYIELRRREEFVEAEKRHARGLYTIEEAAAALGEQQGWHAGARASLLKRMIEAARDGTLTVRDPHTDLPYRPSPVREFYHVVMVADVNAWLERSGVAYTWNPSCAEDATASKKPLPADLREKRAELLRRFRALGGKRRSEGGGGKRGALAQLEKETGIHRKNLSHHLDKAIEDERARALWAGTK